MRVALLAIFQPIVKPYFADKSAHIVFCARRSFGTEKIARLPPNSPEWDTANAPDFCDPAPGDITMYAPWGNLAIFYRDYGFSRGLVPLGKLDSGGAEFFASQSGNFTVTITRADSQKY